MPNLRHWKRRICIRAVLSAKTIKIIFLLHRREANARRIPFAFRIPIRGEKRTFFCHPHRQRQRFPSLIIDENATRIYKLTKRRKRNNKRRLIKKRKKKARSRPFRKFTPKTGRTRLKGRYVSPLLMLIIGCPSNSTVAIIGAYTVLTKYKYVWPSLEKATTRYYDQLPRKTPLKPSISRS